MSYGLTADYWTDAPAAEAEAILPAGSHVSDAGLTVLPAEAPPQVYRSAMIPIVFLLPLAVSALGYFSGGVQGCTDLAFVLVTALCTVLLVIELLTFGRRMGIGAVLIYGGVLIWFCHDYSVNWFLNDFSYHKPFFLDVTIETVSRAMFYHCLFIEMMVLGFRFRPRIWPLRALEAGLTIVPEPVDRRLYVWLAITMSLLGAMIFICTTTFPFSLIQGGYWWVPGVGHATFTQGRTSNFATGIFSYLAQLSQIGQIGGILGAVYALLIARTMAGRAFGWALWAYWLAFTWQGERRGELAFIGLPVIFIVFLKYHAVRDPAQRGRAFLWLAGTFVIASLVWFSVQLQSASRMNSEFQPFRSAGNTMFSEGLNSWAIIPAKHGYAYEGFPGKTFVAPLPDALWFLVIDPIPRILWPDKPVEQFALWYSAMISHDNRGVATGGAQGTTVSSGAVGYWYFRYGPPGVVQGGLFYGFMMGLAERALRRAQGRPLKVLLSTGFAVFLFRSYRDLWWHNLYPILIGAAALTILIRLVFGARSEQDVPIPNGPAFA